jgi:drug/metabolite transporter (DMT)-like permease
MVWFTLAAGLLNSVSKVFACLSQQMGKTGPVALMAYIQIPMSVLVDLYVFRVEFHILNMIAIVLILCTAASLAYIKSQQLKLKKTELKEKK